MEQGSDVQRTSVPHPKQSPTTSTLAYRGPPLGWPRRGRNLDQERAESTAPAGASNPIAVQVRYLDAGQSGQPERLVIEQQIVRIPDSPEHQAKLDAIRSKSRGHGERKSLVEATADYVASLVDNAILRPKTYQWEIQGVPDPAAVSAMLDRSQQWLQGLVKRPIERAAAQVGVPSPVAGAVGDIGANFIIAPVERDVQDATQIIDIIGIIIGTAAGVHPLVIVSIKHLANTQFQKAVADGITNVFDGLLAGSIERPSQRPSHPTPTPRRPSHRPAAPASQLPPTRPRPSTPEQPEPQPSASSPPEPAAAPPHPRIRPTPGISGPGRLG